MNLASKIAHLNPCRDAILWLGKQASPSQAWQDCQRGDWMLWLIGKQIISPPWSEERKVLLSCCLDVAETVKHLWPTRHIETMVTPIAVLRGWIDGTQNVEAARMARKNLYLADTGFAAAYAAANVAYAAADTAAAYVPDNIASSVAFYAAAVAYDGRIKSLSHSADIVRKHFPEPPIK